MSNRNIKLHTTLYWKTARGIVLRRHAMGPLLFYFTNSYHSLLSKVPSRPYSNQTQDKQKRAYIKSKIAHIQTLLRRSLVDLYFSQHNIFLLVAVAFNPHTDPVDNKVVPYTNNNEVCHHQSNK